MFGTGGGNRTLNPLRATDLKSVAYASSATPADNTMEAQVGFAPTNSGFADRSVRLLHHCALLIRNLFYLITYQKSRFNKFDKNNV